MITETKQLQTHVQFTKKKSPRSGYFGGIIFVRLTVFFFYFFRLSSHLQNKL